MKNISKKDETMEDPLTQFPTEKTETESGGKMTWKGKMLAALPVSFGKSPLSGGKKKKNKKKIIIPVLIAAVVVGGVYAHQKQSTNSTTTDSTYTTAEVSRQDVVQSLTGSGTLQPANSYTVTTLKEGKILSADFEEGDIVEKDTVLYQLDTSDASTNIEKAELSLSQAQRNYSDAQDKTQVKANASGVIYSLDVKVGDDITQGQTIATIRDSATMELTVPFPADDAANFYVGETATVTLDGSFETLSGSIKSIGTTTAGSGNSIQRNVTITVKNPGGLGNSQSATASVNGVNCSGSGTFSYKTETTLTASTSGTVKSLSVSEGSSVTKNQVIAVLGGDEIEDSIQSASDNVREQELSLENTQDQLDDYTIKSPIAGTIIDKEYKAGDTTESGQTLCTIYDLTYLELEMSIDELDISLAQVGQEVTITADADDGQSYTGVITKVSVAGTTTNGTTTYPVTVRLDDYGDLLPGMNVDATIVISEEKQALTVPSAAVNRGNTVLITEDSPSAENATDQEAPEGYVYVQVETGISDDSNIVITSGLQEGDTIAYIKTSSSSDDTMMPGGMGEMPSGDMPTGGGGAPSGGGGMPSGGGGGF